jgi:transketolase C-terminal domain/subunit
MLSIMQWIMAGNRGLIYLRVMRTPSPVLYDSNYRFEFGKGQILRETPNDSAVVISSGRGVHEALAAADLCRQRGAHVSVVDMPSIDEELLIQLYQSQKQLIFAEQNNGYIWQSFLKALYRARNKIDPQSLGRVTAINTLTPEGRPQFIHSATYEELTAAFNLNPESIAKAITAAASSLS